MITTQNCIFRRRPRYLAHTFKTHHYIKMSSKVSNNTIRAVGFDAKRQYRGRHHHSKCLSFSEFFCFIVHFWGRLRYLIYIFYIANDAVEDLDSSERDVDALQIRERRHRLQRLRIDLEKDLRDGCPIEECLIYL
jgi:hypothetical protein